MVPMVVVEIMVGEEGHVKDVAVVGEPGEELKIVIKPEVNPQVVLLTEVIIAASTRKLESVMYVLTWSNPGMF